MAAYRCPVCSTNWPLEAKYQACPICDAQCVHRAMENPHEDWEARLELKDVDFSADPVIDWRCDQLMAAGVPRDTAIDWAEARNPIHGGWIVDVYYTIKAIEKYRADGATLEQALRIVAPLW